MLQVKVILVRILEIVSVVLWSMLLGEILNVVRFGCWRVISQIEVVGPQIFAEFLGAVLILKAWLLPPKISLLAAKVIYRIVP